MFFVVAESYCALAFHATIACKKQFNILRNFVRYLQPEVSCFDHRRNMDVSSVADL